MNKQKKQKICNVIFSSNKIKVEIPYGTTILDAARKAGVFIDSLCGGDGVCGKCRVIVREGMVKEQDTDLLTRKEIQEGYFLACKTRIEGDLIVDIPPETQLRGKITEISKAPPFLKEITLRERQPATINPLVKKYLLKLPPPTLENNQADLERLQTVLRIMDKSNEYQMGLKVIRTLPETIRQSNGEVTVTTAYRGSLTEITEVVAGDTSQHSLALAIDAGTTTIMVHLVDLYTGQALGTAAKYNSQSVYGADVIHRLVWCSENSDGLSQLHNIIIQDINLLIQELQNKFHLSKNDINLVVAAGNTIMIHLLLGINSEWIRREPYVGATYQPPAFRAVEVGLTINPRGVLYCLPCVSAFVGADITGGVLAVSMHKKEEIRMLIDIGTNGEIVIGNKDWMVCASASAGPAFEGAGTRDGMRAMRGAIDHIKGWNYYSNFSYSVIEDAAPAGLCGTAYVDLLAELMRMGMMDKAGRLDNNHLSKRFRIGSDGIPEIVVVQKREMGAKRDIVITQYDIANLLRAKGAIYAATKVLLNSLGLNFSDIKEVLIAGAFGNYLDLENAVFIGLLPDLPPEKLCFVGNTSVKGATLVALNRDFFSQTYQIANNMTYFELSTNTKFMDEFIAACFFPHTNIEEFPSVTKFFMEGAKKFK